MNTQNSRCGRRFPCSARAAGSQTMASGIERPLSDGAPGCPAPVLQIFVSANIASVCGLPCANNCRTGVAQPTCLGCEREVRGSFSQCGNVQTSEYPDAPLDSDRAAPGCTPHRSQRTVALFHDQPPVPLAPFTPTYAATHDPHKFLLPRFLHFTQAPRFAELAAETGLLLNLTPHHRSLAQPTGNETTPPSTNTLEWHRRPSQILG